MHATARGRLYAAAHAGHCMQRLLVEPCVGATSLWETAIDTISLLNSVSRDHQGCPKLRTNSDGSAALVYCPGYSTMMTMPRMAIHERYGSQAPVWHRSDDG